MTDASDIRAVVYDLGGVILHVDMLETPRQWARATGRRLGDIINLLHAHDDYHCLGRGEIHPDEFHARWNDRIGPIDSETFFAGWNAALGGLTAHARTVTDALTSRVRQVVLSNTNVPHTEHFLAAHGRFWDRFEKMFFSQDIGAEKPDPAAFAPVLNYLDTPPQQVLFLDDSQPNITAAATLGMQTIHVTDPEQLPAQLTATGLDIHTTDAD